MNYAGHESRLANPRRRNVFVSPPRSATLGAAGVPSLPTICRISVASIVRSRREYAHTVGMLKNWRFGAWKLCFLVKRVVTMGFRFISEPRPVVVPKKGMKSSARKVFYLRTP